MEIYTDKQCESLWALNVLLILRTNSSSVMNFHVQFTYRNKRSSIDSFINTWRYYDDIFNLEYPISIFIKKIYSPELYKAIADDDNVSISDLAISLHNNMSLLEVMANEIIIILENKSYQDSCAIFPVKITLVLYQRCQL